MHPILSRQGRLPLYFLGSMPLGGLLVTTLVPAGGLGWLETAAVILPLTLIFAAATLSAGHLCQYFPLAVTSAPRLLLVHLASAAAESLVVWVVVAKVLTTVYQALGVFAGLPTRFEAVLPMLFGIGVLLRLLGVAVHYAMIEVAREREAERREVEARVLAREAELKALRAQLKPHFLFNTLHSISALATSDGERARRMCVLLADFLRATLSLGEKTSIPLADELALARNYLAIEQVRYGQRLRVAEEIENGCHGCLVPPLLLQPLVENAVKHGIATLLDGGLIRMEARRSKRALRIVIENDADEDAPRLNAGGVGLANVRARLAARYGEDAHCHTEPNGSRFRAEILLPAETTGAIG